MCLYISILQKKRNAWPQIGQHGKSSNLNGTSSLTLMNAGHSLCIIKSLNYFCVKDSIKVFPCNAVVALRS